MLINETYGYGGGSSSSEGEPIRCKKYRKVRRHRSQFKSKTNQKGRSKDVKFAKDAMRRNDFEEDEQIRHEKSGKARILKAVRPYKSLTVVQHLIRCMFVCILSLGLSNLVVLFFPINMINV